MICEGGGEKVVSVGWFREVAGSCAWASTIIEPLLLLGIVCKNQLLGHIRTSHLILGGYP